MCLALAPWAGAVKPAIVGGSQVSIQQAPWQVAVEAVIPAGGGVLCGGSILDAAHILTAAHCVFDSKTSSAIPAEDFIVRAGTSNLASHLEPDEQERAVTSVRPHPYYTYAPDSGHVNPDDVAVLTLAEPLALGPDVSPISMVSLGGYQAEGTPVNLTGFGQQNPEEPLDGKLYSLGMTVGWPRECGGENDAVLICASSPSGTPCNGDSGSGLTISGSTLLGVEDDYFLVSGKPCVAGTENAFTNVAAPEIQDFLDGSEEPPRAPRGGHVVIREAPINDGVMSCEPGTWNGNPTYTYTFLDSTDAQIVQQGASTTYAVPAAEVGHMILCEVQASNAGGTGVGRTPGLLATAAAPLPPPSQSASPETAPPPPPTGHVSLAGTQITTTRGGEATIKLTCTGTGTCRGKLTLTVKTRNGGRKRRSKTTIGTASFSITAGKTATVKLTLNGTGRALLSADHGRLSASLTVLKSSPAPSQAHTETLHLVQRKAAGAKQPRK